MARHNADYIPTEAEVIGQIEATKEYMRTHEDPRKEYIATYEIMSKPMTERVIAMNSKDAAEIVKRNCGMVGWIPVGLKIVEA